MLKFGNQNRSSINSISINKSSVSLNKKSVNSEMEKVERYKEKKEHKMTEEEKEINRKILKNMNKKLNFVKNPRFRNQNKCMLYSNALFSDILKDENPFVVNPLIIIFREYQLNTVYQIDLKLTNRKQISTSFKYIPPSTENFSIKKIIYPNKDSSLIAPGMHAKLEVLFNATSLESFEDELLIITEFFAFKIPLRAIREPPSLTLDNPMDCGKCLLGDQTSMIFRCKNKGGDAHFKFIEQDEFYNNQTPSQTGYTIDNEVLNVGPFSIFPQEFYLLKGMSVEIYVNFIPKNEGVIEKNLFICCDSKINLNHTIKGNGISVDFKIISIDDLILDEKYEKIENIFFEDTFPSTLITRNIKIKNLSEFPLKYHWSIYDMYDGNKFSIEEYDDYFSISPEEGNFNSLQEIIFKITFHPKNCRNYEEKLDLIIEDVPFQAIKNFQNYQESSFSLAKNTFTKGVPFLLALNSPYPSFPIFSFNLRGKGKQCLLDADTKIIDLGRVYLGEKIVKKFNLFNPKCGSIKFKINKIIQGIRNSINMSENKPTYNVNNYFKMSDPGSTVTDHFRTTCIFKLKKQEQEPLNKIFERMHKDVFNILKANETNKSNKLSNDENYNELNIKTEINSLNLNLLATNYKKNLKKSYEDNIKFLRLFTAKENFFGKIFSNENKSSEKKSTYLSSMSTSSKLLNKNIKIKNENVNNNFNSNNISENLLNLNRPTSILTEVTNNFIKGNILNRINSNKNSLNDNKKTYLLNPLTKSAQTKTINNMKYSQLTDESNKSKKSVLRVLKINKSQALSTKINNLKKAEDNTTRLEDEVELNELDELIIKKDQILPIIFVFQPSKLGLFKSSCVIGLDDGIPFSVDFTAQVIGPKIKSDTPFIDFGLFSVSEIKSIKFKLINISKAPAKFLIKESRYKTINLENYLECDYINDCEGIISEKKFKNKIENLSDFEKQNMIVMDINKIDNYEIKFFPISGIILENSEIEICVNIFFILDYFHISLS